MNFNKKYLIIVIFSSISSIGQELSVDIHNSSINDFISIEKKGNGKKIVAEGKSFTNFSESKAIKFARNDISDNDLESVYIIDNDSALISVHKKWESSSPNKLIIDDNIKLQNLFKEKYRTLKNNLESKYGKGMDDSIEESYIGDSFGKIKWGEFGDYLWTPNDSTVIRLKADISPLFEKEQEPTYPAKFKITLITKNTSLTVKGNKLTDKDIEHLNQTKIEFFKSMNNKNFQKAKEYISPFIDEKIKDDMVRFNKEEINYRTKSKYISDSEGTTDLGYTKGVFLEYEYPKPKSNKEVVVILFDEIGKIISLYKTTKN